MIQIDRAVWRVVRFDGEQLEVRTGRSEQPAEAPGTMAEALTELGWTGRSVVLAPTGRQVYPAAISAENLPRRQRRQGMLYRLEEHLPIDAEAFTADLLPVRGDTTLGVAIATAPTAELLDALARVGVEVMAIVPAGLLAAWQWIQADRDRARQTDWLLLDAPGLGDDVEILRLAAGRPAMWYTAPADVEPIVRTLRADRLCRSQEQPETLATVGCFAGHEAESIARAAGLEPADTDESPEPLELAARAAADCLAGRSAGWVDLRTGDLAPAGLLARSGRWVQIAAAMAILLLGALAGGLYWRSIQYDRVVREARGEQVRLFMEAHPGQPAPPDVRLRLESDLRRLAGVRGAAQSVPARPNALLDLRRVLVALPETMRLRILELRLERGRLLLEGQVRTHSDAEAIRARLDELGLVVTAPRTEHLAGGGVGFTLTGRVADVAPPIPTGPGETVAEALQEGAP